MPHVTINGTVVTAPQGAVAYKHADPTEGARWIYDEDERDEIKGDDPSLICEVTAGD